MGDLVIRPSGLDAKPWSLQLRYHGLAETSYATLWRGSRETADEIVEAGAASWLFGHPDGDAALSASPQAPGEAVAWRWLFGAAPAGCWSHSDQPPSGAWADQCRHVQPLYASPVPAGVTREALADVVHTWVREDCRLAISPTIRDKLVNRIAALLAGKGEK